MDGLYNRDWVRKRAASTGAAWKQCAAGSLPPARRYTAAEQQKREAAYDQALDAVESTLKRSCGSRSASDRRQTEQRVTEHFARFSAAALDLHDDAIALLTQDFLPAGTRLARWARRFDPKLAMPDIIQACRNAWTACGLQPLLGERVELTPAILGYSMLYPYSDNYLDREDLQGEAKLHLSRRFRERLRGVRLTAENPIEGALWRLVDLIEAQYPRPRFPQVFDCLLAIHQAQEDSISQVGSRASEDDLLLLSCAKGGSSVLADACLARGWLTEQETAFAFDWGVLLQLGDDLQDVREDCRRGSMTLFSVPAARGEQLDHRVIQLLTFAEHVGDEMEAQPHGDSVLKGLLRMSWRSLILMAVAASHEHFSPDFLAEAETASPFRFAFLRERRDRLAGNQGLYTTLFERLVEPTGENAADPPPALQPACAIE